MKTHIQNSFKFLSIGVSLLISCLAYNATAAVSYWDPNGTTSIGGNSTWDNTSKFWSTTSTQTASASLVAWGPGNAAGFCAGPTGSANQGTFTVTVNGAISCGGIYNGYLNPGPCTVTINNGTSGSLNLPSGIAAFAMYSPASTTVNVPITGVGPIQVQSSGSTILNGANTYTGGFQIDGTGGVSFGNNAAFGTGTITWQVGGFIQPSTTNTYTIPNTMAHLSNGVETFSGNAAGITFSGPWTLPSAGTVTVGNISGNITVSGQISGASALKVSGAGQWFLNGNNNYSGGTQINGDLVNFNNNNSFGTGPILVVASGGALVAEGTSAITIANAFTGTNGSLNIVGNTAGITFSGPMSLGTNTFFLSSGGSSANLVTVSGVISGTGNLVAWNTATLQLNNAMTYTGTTTVSNTCVLALGTSGSIVSSPVTVLSGATLANLTTGTHNIGAATTFNTGGKALFTATGGASTTVGKIGVTGTTKNLTLNNNVITINVTGSALAAGTYRLMDCTGTLSGSANATPTITGTALSSGYTASISTTAGSSGHIDLVVKATPAFSGLTSSPSITYGDTSITLSGTVSSTGGSTTVYPANGETVTATINGHSVNGTVSGSSGAFSIVYNQASLATDGVSGSPYTITYAYAGNSTALKAAANDISTTVTVSPATLSVTPGATKTYGQTVAFGGGSTNFTSIGLKNGETIGSVTLAGSGGAPTDPVSGSPYAISASAATGGTFSAANYNATYNSGTLTVSPASLSVTADNFTRAYGETNPVFSVTYTNFVNGETLGTSDVAGSPVLTTGADTNSPVGAYDITNSTGTLTSTNYAFSLTNGLLTVTNALSTNVVSASANPALPGSSVTLTATLSAIAPSLAVPDGSAQFVIDGVAFGAPVPLTNGVAATNSSTLSHGNHSIEADYAGTTNIVGSTNMISLLINTPPVAGLASYARPRDIPLNISVANLLTNASDADSDALSLVSVSATSTNGAAIGNTNGFVSYTPPGTNGNVTDTFTYTVSDTFGATNTGTVTVTIMPDDSGPSVNITGIATQSDGTVQISFAGIPNRSYLIQATTNVTPPITWGTISTNTAGTNGLFQYIDLDATNHATRYYRTAKP